MGVVFSRTDADRIARSVRAFELGQGRMKPPAAQTKLFQRQERLVRLTTAITGSKVWAAEEVYFDTSGVPQVLAGGSAFNSDIPVITVADATSGDVLLVSPYQRPDGSFYWTGGSAGSGSSESVLKFVVNKNDVSGTNTGVFDDDAEDLGEYADLAALQTEYPTGTSTQAAKVLTNGFYYLYTGGAWTSTGSSALPQVEYAWKNQVNCKVKAGETMILAYVDIGGGSFEWRADLMIFRRLG